jgi:hypothetical protein
MKFIEHMYRGWYFLQKLYALQPYYDYGVQYTVINPANWGGNTFFYELPGSKTHNTKKLNNIKP